MAAAHLSILVKAQDVITHTAGPATFHFMFVSEELLASKASAIIQLTMGQNAKQGALASVHIPNHRHSDHKISDNLRLQFYAAIMCLCLGQFILVLLKVSVTQ